MNVNTRHLTFRTTIVNPLPLHRHFGKICSKFRREATILLLQVLVDLPQRHLGLLFEYLQHFIHFDLQWIGTHFVCAEKIKIKETTLRLGLAMHRELRFIAPTSSKFNRKIAMLFEVLVGKHKEKSIFCNQTIGPEYF